MHFSYQTLDVHKHRYAGTRDGEDKHLGEGGKYKVQDVSRKKRSREATCRASRLHGLISIAVICLYARAIKHLLDVEDSVFLTVSHGHRKNRP